MRYLIIAGLIIVVILLFWQSCSNKQGPNTIIIHRDTVKVLKHRVDTLEREIVKWKEQKIKIVYKTHFDTLATKDTVYVELIKCDSIVKIDSVIIAKQDSIIKDQKIEIKLKDQDIEYFEGELKKQKKKRILDKVIEAVLVVLLIVK